MADPSFRPPNAPPQVATDDTYAAPGEDWDGLPTKVEPSTGEIASGAVPNTPIDAEVRNWFDRDLSRRLLALDMIESQNWPEPAPSTGILAGGGNGTGRMVELPAALERGRALFSFELNDADIYRSDDGGYTWSSDYNSSGSDFLGLAIATVSVAAALVNAGTYKFAKYSTTQAWTETALPVGASAAASVVGDKYSGHYYVLGAKNAGADGAIWRYTEADLPQTPGDISPATSNAQNIIFGAVGPDFVLFADSLSVYTYDRTGTAVKTWDVPNTVFTPYEVQGLVYDQESGFFYAILYEIVGNTSRVYESSDGTTWTRKGAGSELDTLDTSAGIALACRGSVLVLPARAATGSGPYMLAVSGDRGETWSLIPSPIARHGGGAGAVVGLCGSRLYALAYLGTGNQGHAFGLRMGPIP